MLVELLLPQLLTVKMEGQLELLVTEVLVEQVMLEELDQLVVRVVREPSLLQEELWGFILLTH